ncbi:MAG: hypothetical protein PHX86_07815 [Caldisericia bacterium]|nr:hypothetical protein [Caldisericia bacterium]
MALSLPVPVVSSSLAGLSTGCRSILINRAKSDPSSNRYCFFESIRNYKQYCLSYKVLRDKLPIPNDFDFQNIVEKISNFELIESNIDDRLPEIEGIKNSHLLITMSPDGKGRGYTVEKIKQTLHMSNPDMHIFIVSCENGTRVTTNFYMKELMNICTNNQLRHVYFLDSVVDRLVPKKWGFGDDEKLLHIDTEKYFKWTIEYPIWPSETEKEACIGILKNFFHPRYKDHVRFVEHGEYEQEYCMKTFCVNGLHYAIAILQEYYYMKSGFDPGMVNAVLDENHVLYLLVQKAIEDLKKATLRMAVENTKKIDKVVDLNKIRVTIDNYMDAFIERLKLLEDDRRRILSPLMRLADGSQDIRTKMNSIFKSFKSSVCGESILSSVIEEKVDKFFDSLDVMIKEYENFANLHEFEEKLVCRLLEPISYYRFLCSDCDFLRADTPTGNLELERISLLAHYVVLDVCTRWKKNMKKKLAFA